MVEEKEFKQEIGEVYYTMNGKKFNGLGSVVSYYNVMSEDDVPSVANVVYCGVDVGFIDINRLSAEVRRNAK